MQQFITTIRHEEPLNSPKGDKLYVRLTPFERERRSCLSQETSIQSAVPTTEIDEEDALYNDKFWRRKQRNKFHSKRQREYQKTLIKLNPNFYLLNKPLDDKISVRANPLQLETRPRFKSVEPNKRLHLLTVSTPRSLASDQESSRSAHQQLQEGSVIHKVVPYHST